MVILVSIYHHPEFYPPTLNAIINLATIAEKVIVLTRNQMDDDFPYPSNVIILKTGSRVDIKMSEVKSIPWKLFSFLQFVWATKKIIKQHKPALVINYDNIPLLATYMARKIGTRKFRWWYHNHDIAELNKQSKFSIGWMATRSEKKFFHHLDIFSLPAEERKKHFPSLRQECAYFFIPNYPSNLFFKQFYKKRTVGQEVKLVFQGSISTGHGLEEIIKSILPISIMSKNFKLVLKGRIKPDYKLDLMTIARQFGVADKLEFFPVTPYKEVPRLASTCHIGIGIHTGTDVMNITLGTSSNKIYEYAGLGLPVLLYDNPHFRQHLGQYSWAVFTDCSLASLKLSLEHIIANYPLLSGNAVNDFEKNLNFEYYFNRVLDFVKK